MKETPIKQAFKLSIPVFFGYIPLGITFGVLFSTQLNYPWWFTGIMSLFMFAGAGQILAVSLLAQHVNMLSNFVMMFVLNSRHIFYGLSLINAFKGAGWRKFSLIFCLTDETYSILTARARTEDKTREQKVDFYISLFNHSYWIMGSLLGGFLGAKVPFNSMGIEYALIALFVVLTMDQYKVLQAKFPIYAGALSAFIALAIIPSAHQLLLAIVLACLALWYQFKQNSHLYNINISSQVKNTDKEL